MTQVLVPEGVDQGLLWHCGNPSAEQRSLESGSSFVVLENRPVFVIRGADRLSWLNSLSSQLIDGQWHESYILDPRGRVEHYYAGSDVSGEFVGFTEPGRLEALLDFLNSMRFALRVEIEQSDHLVVFQNGQTQIVENLDGLSGTRVGTWAWDALRIASGQPRPFLDTDDRTIPNELFMPSGQRLGPAVHLNKGCYRGQETVARVLNVGRPPRRLALLHLDGSEDRLPAVGSDVFLGESSVGRMGTSVQHHELGPIGLALLKRNTPTEVELAVDGIAAGQEILVTPDVGLHVRMR